MYILIIIHFDQFDFFVGFFLRFAILHLRCRCRVVLHPSVWWGSGRSLRMALLRDPWLPISILFFCLSLHFFYLSYIFLDLSTSWFFLDLSFYFKTFFLHTHNTRTQSLRFPHCLFFFRCSDYTTWTRSKHWLPFFESFLARGWLPLSAPSPLPVSRRPGSRLCWVITRLSARRARAFEVTPDRCTLSHVNPSEQASSTYPRTKYWLNFETMYTTPPFQFSTNWKSSTIIYGRRCSNAKEIHFCRAGFCS